MKRRNHLVECARAFQRFHDRGLWRRFTDFRCVGVDVENEANPYLVTVLPLESGDFILEVFQGPESIRQMTLLQTRFDLEEEELRLSEVMLMNRKPLIQVSARLREAYRKGGLRMKPETPVPVLHIVPTRGNPRDPKDSEAHRMRILIETILEADDRNLLDPGFLDDAEGLCVLVPGEGKRREVSAHRKRFESVSASKIESERTFTADDLVGLPRLNETWLVAVLDPPITIRNDARAFRLLPVADKVSGMVLEAHPFPAESPHEALGALIRTFHESPFRPEIHGLPWRILFACPELHETAGPVLEKAGVHCTYRERIPEIDDIYEAMSESLFRGDGSSSKARTSHPAPPVDVPASGDLDGWKMADYRLTRRFLHFLDRDKRLESSRAVKRYFGDDDLEFFLDEFEMLNVRLAYATWGVVDYRPTIKSRTQAEILLDRGIPLDEEKLLRARMNAHPSIWRMEDYDPEAGTITFEDSLLGGRKVVHDRTMAEGLTQKLFLPCRIFEAGDFHFLDIVGPPLIPRMVPLAIGFLEAHDIDFTPENLRRNTHVFGRMWDHIDDWNHHLAHPRITNTDGE